MDQYNFLKYQLISCFPISCTCMSTLKLLILPPLKLALKFPQMCHNFPVTPQFHLQNPLKTSNLPPKSPPQKPTNHPFFP